MNLWEDSLPLIPEEDYWRGMEEASNTVSCTDLIDKQDEECDFYGNEGMEGLMPFYGNEGMEGLMPFYGNEGMEGLMPF